MLMFPSVAPLLFRLRACDEVLPLNSGLDATASPGASSSLQDVPMFPEPIAGALPIGSSWKLSKKIVTAEACVGGASNAEINRTLGQLKKEANPTEGAPTKTQCSRCAQMSQPSGRLFPHARN